jgi:hypothetical protein
MAVGSANPAVFYLPFCIQPQHRSCRRVAHGGRNGSGRRCPVVGRRAPGRSSTDCGEDVGEELNEAVAMSSTGNGDELDESGMEELRDKDHDERMTTVGRSLTRRR